jgi:metallophosphoesterase (TIGR00282 family)
MAEQVLRVICLGDVVGDPGLEAIERLLPPLIEETSADFVMLNGENAAAGFGLTLAQLTRILATGVDVISSGNHIWEKRDFWQTLETEERILRPLNYAEGSPGRGWVRIEKPSRSGTPVSWVALNLQGRELMTAIDCPFKAFDSFEANLLSPAGTAENSLPGELHTPSEKPVILVDFHAESTLEKEALAYYLDGRAGIVAGTHTHIQTADERLLPKGTAYITDLGMCGLIDSSVIGMDTKICQERARSQVLYRMEAAKPSEDHKSVLKGILVELDAASKKPLSIKRL